jgi:hypothetical protein
MPTYLVQVQRTQWITLTVEAQDDRQARLRALRRANAETLAWQHTQHTATAVTVLADTD